LKLFARKMTRQIQGRACRSRGEEEEEEGESGYEVMDKSRVILYCHVPSRTTYLKAIYFIEKGANFHCQTVCQIDCFSEYRLQCAQRSIVTTIIDRVAGIP